MQAQGDEAGDIAVDGCVVRWERPGEVPGVELLGYHVEYRETGGVELDAGDGTWSLAELGPDALSYKVVLVPGMGVEVRVAAKNVNGVGACSEVIVSRALPDKPDAPSALTPSDLTDSSLLLSWTKPHVKGAVLLEYEVVPVALSAGQGAEGQDAPRPANLVARLVHPAYLQARLTPAPDRPLSTQFCAVHTGVLPFWCVGA